MINDSQIKQCKAQLSALYSRKHELERVEEDVQIIPGSELDSLIHQIDQLIEGEYAEAVFNYYSEKKPLLIRNLTGEEIKWNEAYGDSFAQTTKGQRHSLVGLIEGGSKYRFK